MRPITPGEISIDFLTEEIFDVLIPITNRILIEARRQQGLIDRYNQQESKSALSNIETQWNKIDEYLK